jgi:hypothetical protein
MYVRGQKAVSIYTVLAILDQMKGSLGLEAMMEYMETYKKTIEMNDPRLRLAVNKAMEVINVEDMYTQACGDNI